MTFQFTKKAPPSNEESGDLSDASFERISDLIYKRSGIVLASHKKQMAQARIARRLRSLNLPSFEAYLDQLENHATEEENIAFINALTTNLTSFFREPHHFTHFKEVLFPKLANESRLRFWSAASSTGEEPYSMALTAKELLRQKPNLDLKILATDIDTNVLNTASKGVYSCERVSDLGPDILHYFNGFATNGSITIPPDVRRMITFKRLNLMENWPFKGEFNAIFCRNVIIYFEAEQRKQLVNRMVERIQPGGYLYLGHSEALIEQHPRLENEGHTIYRKV